MARKAKKTSRKSKKKVVDKSISLGDDASDLWEKTRAACRLGVEKAFDKVIKSETIKEKDEKFTPAFLAEEYERNLFGRFGSSMKSYRQRFRKDLISMRNEDTEFAANLLYGEMKMEDFCNLKESELISKKQKNQDKQLLAKELRQTIAPALPTKVTIQNTILRTKWVTESVAKIDPRFDN